MPAHHASTTSHALTAFPPSGRRCALTLSGAALGARRLVRIGRRAAALQPDGYEALCALARARLAGAAAAVELDRMRVHRLRRALSDAAEQPELGRHLIESAGHGRYRLAAGVRLFRTADFAVPPAGNLLSPDLHATLVARLPCTKRSAK